MLVPQVCKFVCVHGTVISRNPVSQLTHTACIFTQHGNSNPEGFTETAILSTFLQDKTVKAEESEPTASTPNPKTPAADGNNSSIKVSKKRKRKRQHSTKTPLVSDGELNKSDDIEDISAAADHGGSSTLQVRHSVSALPVSFFPAANYAGL